MTRKVEHSPQKLHETIREIRFAMFTTRAADGTLHARPMTTQTENMGPPALDQLWFFMSRSSEPVKELLVDPRVNVSYIGSENDVYISVAGSARMVDDMPSKERFWSSMVEAWFPQGITDPDLVLVCVEIDSAEYWNMTDGKLTQLAKMAKAVWKGEPPTDMAEHGTIG